MISYNCFTLSNGLKVIHHYEENVSTVCMNILYNVGARHEEENKTGFAHLFEHLMFGGSIHVPDFDRALQEAGGNNNAYTTNDYTNYYDIVPAENIETAFWLESDRMLSLSFSEKSLEVQRQVVMEEFRQRYLNQPYGDIWLLFHPLAYTTHPYRWPTIGKEISHIEQACLEDVKNFFNRFYHPGNAILCVAGNITEEKAIHLSKKWFEPIPSKPLFQPEIPAEPPQREKRFLEVMRPVPADKIIMGWKMPGLKSPYFRTYSLLARILSGGDSSLLIAPLVKEKKIFSSLSAYPYGLLDDPGLFLISGTLTPGHAPEQGEKEIYQILNKIMNDLLPEREVQKAKNKVLTELAFSNYDMESRASNLCFYEWLGILDEINKEEELYDSVTREQIRDAAAECFRENQSSVLYYLKQNE